MTNWQELAERAETLIEGYRRDIERMRLAWAERDLAEQAEADQLSQRIERVRAYAKQLRTTVGGRDFQVGTDILAVLDGENDTT